MSPATYERINAPLSITPPIDCNPSENCMPSNAVGRDGKVLNTLLPSIPFLKGVYFLGSKVSVCAMPPAIHNNITVSAVESLIIFFLVLQPLSMLGTGAPAANAASVARLVLLIKSLRFQFDTPAMVQDQVNLCRLR